MSQPHGSKSRKLVDSGRRGWRCRGAAGASDGHVRPKSGHSTHHKSDIEWPEIEGVTAGRGLGR
jgi:hypothetical protein